MGCPLPDNGQGLGTKMVSGMRALGTLPAEPGPSGMLYDSKSRWEIVARGSHLPTLTSRLEASAQGRLMVFLLPPQKCPGKGSQTSSFWVGISIFKPLLSRAACGFPPCRRLRLCYRERDLWHLPQGQGQRCAGTPPLLLRDCVWSAPAVSFSHFSSCSSFKDQPFKNHEDFCVSNVM